MLKRLLVLVLTALAAALGWCVLVFVTVSEGWLRQPLVETAEPAVFFRAVREQLAAPHDGNISFILLEAGEVVRDFHHSSGRPVDGDSLYQVASLSKWLSAWGVMVLVQDGAVDLDAPVSHYLSRWELPPSAFDRDGVTVRRLLSHTAGLDDGLGYAGFDSPGAVQSLEDSLSMAADASPGAAGTVRVAREPGSGWDYSGGGYTLLQLLVEEVSGLAFSDFMAARVFAPLGMTRTTFDHGEALSLGVAENYRADGSIEPLRYYTAQAAASAFTSTRDLTLFLQAQAPGERGAAEAVLSRETQRLMRRPHAAQLGADIWGLGVMLYAPNNAGDFIIGHDGSNEPAINTAARLDPATGDGIVVLETGDPMLATRIAGEWVFWKTGRVDSLSFAAAFDGMLKAMAAGLLVIVLATLVLAWRGRRGAR